MNAYEKIAIAAAVGAVAVPVFLLAPGRANRRQKAAFAGVRLALDFPCFFQVASET